MKIKTLLMPLTLAAGMALSAGVPAQEVDNDFSVYAGGVRYLFDTHKDQQNEEGYYIGLEFPLFDRVSLAVEHYEVDSDFKNQRGESDFSLDRLGFNYHLNMLGNWQPYMSLGFGDLELDPRPTGFGPVQLDETSYDLGVGIKRDFGEYFMVRGDLKGIHGRQTSDWDTVIGISAGFTFGGARPAPAPAPAPEPEPIVAAPVDSDGDGVNDPSDRCPNTPRQLAVDANGCPILQTTQESQELLVEFEFDSDVIRPEYNGEIEEFAEFMQTYTNTEVVIEGHTDSTGPEEYNQELSERRAEAVREALIDAGIPASRITAVGHGESRPVAGNDNPEGRERNRRIVAEVSVEVEEEVLR